MITDSSPSSCAPEPPPVSQGRRRPGGLTCSIGVDGAASSTTGRSRSKSLAAVVKSSAEKRSSWGYRSMKADDVEIRKE